MSSNEFLNEYKGFVDQITSQPSKDLEALITRLREIDASGINIARMLTGVIGANSEGGEFAEIIKKFIFQGKPITDENKRHLRLELGDEIWYWMQKCLALDIDPTDVIRDNVNKLKSRYPEFEFSVDRSEHRREGDL